MTRKFFRFVWRANALIIAAAGLAALLWMVGLSLFLLADWIGPPSIHQALPVAEDRTGAPSPEEDAPKEYTAAFMKHGDTDLLRASVYRDALIVRGGLSDSRGYKSSNSEIDWIFYDPAARDPEASTWRLLQDDPVLLIDARLLEEPKERAPRSLAVFVRYVTEDGNEDGLLTASDPTRYALADAHGQAFNRLALEGEYVSLTVTSADEAILVLKQDQELLFAHLDLGARTVSHEVRAPISAVSQD